MSQRKYLLASGCSYTNPNYVSGPHPEMDCSWPKWPEIVADKLGLEVINLGRNGMGYKYIVDSLMPHIVSHPEDIEVVMVGWSETWREVFFHGAGVNLLADFTAIGRLLSGNFTDEEAYASSYFGNGAKAWRKWYGWEVADRPINILFLDCGWKNKTLSKEFMLHLYGDVFKNVAILQRICRSYNIPLVQGNLLNMDIGAMYKMLIEDEGAGGGPSGPMPVKKALNMPERLYRGPHFNRRARSTKRSTYCTKRAVSTWKTKAPEPET